MGVVSKLILILFGLAYLVSPVDLIPDLLVPYVGWIDDSLVIWCIYYLIRHGDLPWFFFKKPTPQNIRHTAGARPARPKRQAPKKAAPKAENENTRETPKPDPPPSNSSPPPHEILGVELDASWDTIQKAYKEKVKQYHPDKLSHLGEEFSHLANKKFLEIQTAYAQLKQNRRKQ